MTREDIYEQVFIVLDKYMEHNVIDTPDGIGLVGEDADDVWLVVVNKATLTVAP